MRLGRGRVVKGFRAGRHMGQKFGIEGHGYMRVNLGCSRITVEDAITRLTSAVAAIEQHASCHGPRGFPRSRHRERG